MQQDAPHENKNARWDEKFEVAQFLVAAVNRFSSLKEARNKVPTSDKFLVAVYRVFTVFIDNAYRMDEKMFGVVYKGDGLRFNMYACYSWVMALNFSLQVSFKFL
jgi:hypothetical protein